MTRAWLAIALIAGAPGCAYRLQLSSVPNAVTLELPSGEQVITPEEAVFRWRPFGKQIVRASATGYRTVSFDLRRDEIRWSRYVTDTLFRPATLLGAPRGDVRFVLVPEHGPVGTWAEDEVP